MPHRVAEIPQPVAQDHHAKAQGQEEHEEDENRMAQDVHGQATRRLVRRRCIGDGTTSAMKSMTKATVPP